VRDLSQHPAIDVLGDQLAQRCGVGDRLGAEQAGQNLGSSHHLGIEGGP
jgi:hypothetical protein